MGRGGTGLTSCASASGAAAVTSNKDKHLSAASSLPSIAAVPNLPLSSRSKPRPSLGACRAELRALENWLKRAPSDAGPRSSTPQALAADAPRAFRRRCWSATCAAGAVLRAYFEWTRRGRDGGPPDHSQTEGISWSRTSLRFRLRASNTLPACTCRQADCYWPDTCRCARPR